MTISTQIMTCTAVNIFLIQDDLKLIVVLLDSIESGGWWYSFDMLIDDFVRLQVDFEASSFDALFILAKKSGTPPRYAKKLKECLFLILIVFSCYRKPIHICRRLHMYISIESSFFYLSYHTSYLNLLKL